MRRPIPASGCSPVGSVPPARWSSCCTAAPARRTTTFGRNSTASPTAVPCCSTTSGAAVSRRRRAKPRSTGGLVAPAPTFEDARAAYNAEFARRQAAPDVAAARAELSQSGLRERDPDAFWRRAFELSVAGYFKEPSRARRLTPFRVGQRAQKAVWDSLRGMDLRPRLGAIRVPTLILHGRHDPVPLAASEELERRIPGARLVVFEDSGHALYSEETDRFVALLDEFLPKAIGERGAGSGERT